MKSILYIGMDVHKESYTVCSYSYDRDVLEHQQKLSPDYKMVLKYLEQLRKHSSEEVEFICGYEAGCLGYTLNTWRKLRNSGAEYDGNNQ